jgi:hypothetical protein
MEEQGSWARAGMGGGHAQCDVVEGALRFLPHWGLPRRAQELVGALLRAQLLEFEFGKAWGAPRAHLCRDG